MPNSIVPVPLSHLANTLREMAYRGIVAPIAPIPTHLRRAALELVFGDLPDDERREQVEAMLNGAEGKGGDLAGLMGVQVGNAVVGAVLAQVQPGGTAAVWLPRLAGDTLDTAAYALMEAACNWLEGQAVTLAQALLAEVTKPDRKLLERAQFTHLAELLYLVVPSDRSSGCKPAGLLRFVPVKSGGPDRFAAIVEATYEATRDCPGLDGVRAIDDVLAGYQAVGRSGADEWFFVRCDGEDVGCLMLADHPRQGSVELVYMGVLPAWRGRGWGAEIAQWSQSRAGALGRDRLVLAVDAENGPALAAYAAAGFRAWEQRSVYIRTFET